MEEVLKCIGEFCYDPNSKPIGTGIFSAVYKGHKIKNPSEEVAIKVIPSDILQQYKDNRALFIREVDVLKNIKGKYILGLKDAMQSKSNVYLVTNYCNGGSLESEINTKKKLPIREALKYLQQMAEALESIGKLDIRNSSGQKIVLIHRDIKPANILLHNGEAMLADFGFSKFVPEVGSPLYRAPQIIERQDYSSKCDVWSMGVVTYELIFGRQPWTGSSQTVLLQNIKQVPLSFEEPTHKEVKDLLSKMLEYDEKRRMDWKQVLEHPVFKKLDELDKPSFQGETEITTHKQNNLQASVFGWQTIPETTSGIITLRRDMPKVESKNESVVIQLNSITHKNKEILENMSASEEDLEETPIKTQLPTLYQSQIHMGKFSSRGEASQINSLANSQVPDVHLRVDYDDVNPKKSKSIFAHKSVVIVEDSSPE